MAESIIYRNGSDAIVELSMTNPLPSAANLSQNLATKTVTFAGTAGLGAQGATKRFTVTGVVRMRIFAVGEVNVAGATATIALGVTGNTTALIAQATATNIAAGKLWQSNTPVVGISALSAVAENIVSLDVLETIATADITGGRITYYCLWSPISAGATVTAA